MPVFASLLAASLAGGVRVASLNLCSDEYLLLLARPGEVASVSRLVRDRAESPLWRRARAYPGNGGRLEQVLATKPNLVLTMGGGGRSTGEIARRMGMRVVDLPFRADMAGVEANMVRVAAALGDVRRADGWRARLARLRATTGTRQEALYLGGGGVSLAPGSLGGQWMRLAGLEQRVVPGGRVTLEQMAARPPAILLRSTYRRGEVSLGQRWLDHPLAKRAGRTVATDGRPWLCAGPLMPFEIERLRGEL
jgi:iron complex transport system substrate-binding protein